MLCPSGLREYHCLSGLLQWLQVGGVPFFYFEGIDLIVDGIDSIVDGKELNKTSGRIVQICVMFHCFLANAMSSKAS